MTETSHLVVHWETVTDELMDRTAKFPRTARFSLGDRIDNIAIDVLEQLVTARYTTGDRRRAALSSVNLSLARLRVLVRLAHRRMYFSGGAYEALSESIDECGRMLGGWIREQGKRPSRNHLETIAEGTGADDSAPHK